MTGRELLEEEMRKRGATESQIKSKTFALTLDTIAQTDIHTKVYEEEQHLLELQKRCQREQHRLDKIMELIDSSRKSLDRSREELKEKEDAISSYVDRFNRSLTECETAEGRDAMRRTQLFMNTVKINNDYDNTAFIKGLAMILSSGPFGNMTDLQRVSPDLHEDN